MTDAVQSDPLDDLRTYTTSEVADVFRVTPETVRDWITSGKLKAVRLPSGRFRVTHQAMRQFGTQKYETENPSTEGGADPELI